MEGCHGRMSRKDATEGCHGRMSWKVEVGARQEKKKGGCSVQDDNNAWINI